ncbi:MAG: NAAT family transporter [Aquificae bacterium]|nr:NAAT family transporter [Aquificota bacterium]
MSPLESYEFNSIFQTFLHFEIGLLTILNPIAASAIMLSLINQPTNEKEIKRVAKRTSITVLIASLCIVIFGELILKMFGINVYSIKVIGGIILMLISIRMVQGEIIETTRHSTEERKEAKEREDISVIPLAIPVLVGPGTMATLLVFKIKTQSLLDLVALFLAIIVATIVVYISLKNATIFVKVLKITGLKIITRIMGLIVGAIASQFIIAGIKSLWQLY